MTDDIESFFAPYDSRLVFELALALDDLPSILDRYNVSVEQFEKLKKNTGFMKQVAAQRAEIREKGLSFREKAKAMAEDLLKTAYEIIHTPTTPSNVKADLIKWSAKVAGLEPTEKPDAGNGLPAIVEAIKKLSDGELELRVTQLVARQSQSAQTPAIDVTPRKEENDGNSID
jgi:hypothetical protein